MARAASQSDHSLFRCLHCGAAGTRRYPRQGDIVRYVCPDCGPYRISAMMEALVAEPDPGQTQGGFVVDRPGVRWFVMG